MTAVQSVDLNGAAAEAVTAIHGGTAAADYLAAFVRRHDLDDHEVLVLLVLAADLVNRRKEEEVP